MNAHYSTLETFTKELARIGLDCKSVGPIEAVVVAWGDSDGTVRLYDDVASWEGSERTALEKLAGIPDGEGPELFWDAFPPQ